MKIRRLSNSEELSLPNDLLWTDEFDWSPLVSATSFSLGGALFVEQGLKLAGRPFTLRSAQPDMAWITRAAGIKLLQWGALPNETFRLILEYPTDARTFDVIFDTTGAPMALVPVKEYPAHEDNDVFLVTVLKLIGV